MNFFALKILKSSIRSKLTVWFGSALALILAVYSVGLYVFLRHNLVGELDRKLWEDVESVQETLQDLPTSGQESEQSLALDRYQDPEHHDIRERWMMEVWDANLQKLHSIPSNVKSPLGQPSGTECSIRRGKFSFQTLSDGLKLRVLCSKVQVGGLKLYVRVARSAEHVMSELTELLTLMIFGVPLAIAFAMLGGYWLARRSLQPIQQMTSQARQIHADRLTERLPIANPHDELGQLAQTFNQTFERLEKSFNQMRRFAADASHELRTPLTAIRTMGEVSLREQRDAGSYRETLSSVLEESDRLRNLVDSLLTLSRADAGQIRLNKKEEELAVLVAEVTEVLGVLAEEKKQRLVIETEAGVRANIDRSVFKQAVVNLVENAIKYSPPETTIHVSLVRSPGEIVVSVRDHGPGIAAEHRERIFERFYRIDEGRSREQGGTGLGLSIAKWAVEAHQGSVTVESSRVGGSTFLIRLPS